MSAQPAEADIPPQEGTRLIKAWLLRNTGTPHAVSEVLFRHTAANLKREILIGFSVWSPMTSIAKT